MCEEQNELFAIYGLTSFFYALSHSHFHGDVRARVSHRANESVSIHKCVPCIPPLEHEQRNTKKFNIKLSINRLLHIIRNHYGYCLSWKISKYYLMWRATTSAEASLFFYRHFMRHACVRRCRHLPTQQIGVHDSLKIPANKSGFSLTSAMPCILVFARVFTFTNKLVSYDYRRVVFFFLLKYSFCGVHQTEAHRFLFLFEKARCYNVRTTSIL